MADAFYNAMGSGYIADALKTAHAAEPNAKLYLNDYNIEGENAKSNTMYWLAQSLLAQGVKLSGIGSKASSSSGGPSDVEANMRRFANLGLDVAVPELDDRIQLPASSANLQQQATDFATIVKDCLERLALRRVSQSSMATRTRGIPEPLRLGRGHHVRRELQPQARLHRGAEHARRRRRR